MVDQETRTCQNCKQSFVVEPEDFDFYEKMKVPAPTFCPECRMIRRFSFYNIFNLYKRNCSKCDKNIVSIYSPDKKKIVYCSPCWWADDWDGSEYTMDYDPSKPFIEQIKELTEKTPWQALESAYLTIKNTEYANALGHCKDSYLIFWADYCENVYYSTFLDGLKDSLDCYRVGESELLYECIGGVKCYRVFFSEDCESCTDVWFSKNCTGCTNCFGCVNLRNKSYYIFNEPYSKEEYSKKIKELNLTSRKSLDDLKNKVYEFWNKYPRRYYTGGSLNVNVTGDYIRESKNAKHMYMAIGAEDSKFSQFISVAPAKDCYDYSGWGNGAQRIYEAAVVGEGADNIKFSAECWPNAIDNEYSLYVITSKHVLGCVNLKRKDYSILNKQYTKEEFEKLSTQIKEDMVKNPYVDKNGRVYKYGEFFPIEISPFAYNETMAHQFFPKSKEEVLKEGYKWHEAETPQYKITIRGDELPDIIQESGDSMLQEVIECIDCKKAYKIVQGELNLMRKLELPIPSKCSNCRQKARFARTNPPQLYDRKCAECNRDIKTSYAPDRSEIVYCESCYQEAVI